MTEMTFSISLVRCGQSEFDYLLKMTLVFEKKCKCRVAGLPMIRIPFQYDFVCCHLSST